MKKTFTFYRLLFCCLGVMSTQLYAATIFVDVSASGNEDGASWVDAYTTLYEALENATSGDDVWVAAGTYYASATDFNGDSLVIPGGVELYGGFAGTETMLGERDVLNNTTIISGNIGDEGNGSDNTRHIFYIEDAAEAIVIDGFTIQEAYCGGAGCNGGGLYITNSAEVYIQNCIIQDNIATQGSAFRVDESSTVYVYNSKILNNSNLSAGGIVFIGRTQSYFVNTLVHGNNARGAMAIFSFQAGAEAHIINCTIAYNIGNSLAKAGAVSSSAGSINYVSNSILWGNTIDGDASEMSQISNYNTAGYTYLDHSIVQNYTGTGSVTGENIVSGTYVSSADPLFQGETAATLYLTENSPAINTGVNDSLPGDLVDIDNDGNTSETVPLDLDGETRVQETVVDLGAFESEYTGGEYTLGVYGKALEVATYKVFPNPSYNSTNVSFTLSQPAEVSILVTDLQGKVVATVAQNLFLGANTYAYEVGDLLPGTYLVSLRTGTGVESQLLRVVD